MIDRKETKMLKCQEFIEKLEKRHQTTFNGKTLTELSQFINQYT